MAFKNPWQRTPQNGNNPWEMPKDTASHLSDPAQLSDVETQFTPRMTQTERLPPSERLDFMEAMRRNQRNTWLLITMMLGLTALFGYVLGWAWDVAFGGLMSAGMQYAAQQHIDWMRIIMTRSETGVMIGIALLAGMSVWTLITLWRADKMVLRMTDAVDAPHEMIQLHNIVEEISIAAGVPKPRVVIVPTHVPNAFATGLRQDKAVIGVTQGLLQRLNRRELQAVVAHEMGHIMNGDMRYATILSVMAGVLVFVAELIMHSRGLLYFGGQGGSRSRQGGGNPFALIILVVIFIIAAIVVPLLARLIQMAISRQREYLADATAVQLTRDPGGMIAALEKIADLQEPAPQMKSALEPLFIMTPVKMWQNGNIAWFSTHPPLQKRIERLKALE